MSEFLPEDPAPEPSERRPVAEQAADLARTTFSVMKSILFMLPLVAMLIIVALALMGPAVGNIFSNIVSSL